MLKRRTFYQPIHSAWIKYAAALYLSSIYHYANNIQRKLYSLPLDAEAYLTTSAGIHRSSPQVLFFLCSVLSKKAYLLFNTLSPLNFPVFTLLAFLQTPGNSNVVLLVALLLPVVCLYRHSQIKKKQLRQREPRNAQTGKESGSRRKILLNALNSSADCSTGKNYPEKSLLHTDIEMNQHNIFEQESNSYRYQVT